MVRQLLTLSLLAVAAPIAKADEVYDFTLHSGANVIQFSLSSSNPYVGIDPDANYYAALTPVFFNGQPTYFDDFTEAEVDIRGKQMSDGQPTPFQLNIIFQTYTANQTGYSFTEYGPQLFSGALVPGEFPSFLTGTTVFPTGEEDVDFANPQILQGDTLAVTEETPEPNTLLLLGTAALGSCPTLIKRAISRQK